MVRQRVLKQKNKKLRAQLAKCKRSEVKKSLALKQKDKKYSILELELEKVKFQQKLKQFVLPVIQPKIIINRKAQNIFQYYDYDKKTAVLKYIRLGIRGYQEESLLYKETLNIVLPCESAVRDWKNQMISKLKIATIAATFDGSKPMNHVIQWKKNNNLKDNVIYDATIQIDAAYINQQCCQGVNGLITNSMKNSQGKIAGIRYIFGFVLVLEKDVPALPLFLQTACDGCARQEQLDAYFQLCNCLKYVTRINFSK
ncbi:Hypothetical_protein [Hexamita inflata]|uniref:Hypothetical_protein n=1 Tax=Hexamita inflata TaxID=28002 RepID=A0AA86NQC0_9EUKA|nr:Hypothetical protein HINF_LOCUS11033 [Hexamita inflata]